MRSVSNVINTVYPLMEHTDEAMLNGLFMMAQESLFKDVSSNLLSTAILACNINRENVSCILKRGCLLRRIPLAQGSSPQYALRRCSHSAGHFCQVRMTGAGYLD